MMVTISDISRHVGLSTSTVSKALNNYSDVSLETRERVMEVARELGYQPSATARNLRRGRTDKIGLFINNSVSFLQEYLGEVVPGAAFIAEQKGYNLVLYTTTIAHPDALLPICRGREVDGMLLLWTNPSNDILELLEGEQMPYVVLGRRVDRESTSFVTPDNYDGALQLTRHLLHQGHRRIGFMSRPQHGPINDDRFGGYRQALEEAGIPLEESLIIPTVIEPRSGYNAANKLLDLPEPPTAIFAFYDLMAMGALQAVQERGLRVPDDIAVVGFDGLRSSETATPSITTVRQPLGDMGFRATEILMSRIDDNEQPPIQEVFPIELLIRESSQPRQKKQTLS